MTPSPVPSPENTPVPEKQTAKPDGELVQFPAQSAKAVQSPKVDLSGICKNPLTREAWNHYQRHGALGKGVVPIRCFLPVRHLRVLATALERQVTVEDLKLIIGLEACTATCSLTEKQFQPVWWACLSERFLQTVRRYREIRPELVHKLGCFFLHPDISSDDILVASGYPYSWGAGGDKGLTDMPIVKAYQANDCRWGYSRDRIDEALARRRAQRQAQADAEGRITRMGDKLEQFFGKKK